MRVITNCLYIFLYDVLEDRAKICNFIINLSLLHMKPDYRYLDYI